MVAATEDDAPSVVGQVRAPHLIGVVSLGTAGPADGAAGPWPLDCSWSHGRLDEAGEATWSAAAATLRVAVEGRAIAIGDPEGGAGGGCRLPAGLAADPATVTDALWNGVVGPFLARARMAFDLDALPVPRDLAKAETHARAFLLTDPALPPQTKSLADEDLATLSPEVRAAFVEARGAAPGGGAPTREGLAEAIAVGAALTTLGGDPTATEAVGDAVRRLAAASAATRRLVVTLHPEASELVAALSRHGTTPDDGIPAVRRWATERASEGIVAGGLSVRPDGAQAARVELARTLAALRGGWAVRRRRLREAGGRDDPRERTKGRFLGSVEVLGERYDLVLESEAADLELRVERAEAGNRRERGGDEGLALSVAVLRERPRAGRGLWVVVPREASAGEVATLLARLVDEVIVPKVAELVVGDDDGWDEVAPIPAAAAVPRGGAETDGGPEGNGVDVFDEAEVRRELARGEHDDRDAAALRNATLRRMIDDPRGPRRALVVASEGAAAAVDAVGVRAPHLAEVTATLRRHVQASARMGTPIRLPPLVMVGEPGTGKTWYLSRVAAALGVPFRAYPMNMASLSEGLAGSHPSWRGAGPGVVAAALLDEAVANPVVLVDEIDKAVPTPNNGDPYRAFYSLLEREGARAFRDEYLGVGMRADGVLWVATANDLRDVPAPIVDRLTVVEVPPIDPDHGAVVAVSVYGEANQRNRGFFAPEPAPAVVAALATRRPRDMRVAVEDAMTRAAARGAREVGTRDLPPPRGLRGRVGFARD